MVISFFHYVKHFNSLHLLVDGQINLVQLYNLVLHFLRKNHYVLFLSLGLDGDFLQLFFELFFLGLEVLDVGFQFSLDLRGLCLLVWLELTFPCCDAALGHVFGLGLRSFRRTAL